MVGDAFKLDVTLLVEKDLETIDAVTLPIKPPTTLLEDETVPVEEDS
jgi:hypothetical protein